jgi:ring-1,2-phenylacetyl-CoA epoxidase subunit PaaC
MQAGIDSVWPYVAELFESDEVVRRLATDGVAVDPSDLDEPTLAYVEAVLAEASLTRPDDGYQHSGGRRGIHTEQMGYLLAEMQHLARSHPGATW